MDQMLHKDTLSAHEAESRLEMSDCLSNLTLEDAFQRVKSKRDDFIANQCEYPFVLQHGDLHGRNVIVRYVRLFLKLVLPNKPTFSHSSPHRILAILDWDFGGSHILPFADKRFEACWPDFDDDDAVRMNDAEEMDRFQTFIDELAGALSVDVELNQLVLYTKWYVLNREALKPSRKDSCASTCLDDFGVDAVGSVHDDAEMCVRN